MKADNKKQGSRDDIFESSIEDNPSIAYENLCNEARNKYLYWVNTLNICPEQARMILPQSMKTEWYWSGTLMAFARVCNLRCKPDSQKETRIITDKIDIIGKEEFPVSWNALRK